MPTRNRRRFVGQAITYFLRQDYPRKELVIVDDGEDAIADLVPQDERIRYIRLDTRIPLGAKRNLACQASQGELIAHWDDDDWMAPHRLSLQVAELMDGTVDVCGARDLLHYSPSAGQAWLYRYPDDARAWLAGGTLLYRRSAWEAQPFPEVDVGEDNAFVWQIPAERLRVVPDSRFYVAIIHPQNSARKNLRDLRWEPRPIEDVSRLLAADRGFYVAVRNGRSASELATGHVLDSVTVAAPFMVYDGYGSMAEYLVLGMERAGARVHVVPLNLDIAGLSDELQQVIRRSSPASDAPVLYFCWPRADLEQFQHHPSLFVNTMWESSRLPADWTPRLNQTRTMIVPTRFVAQVCRESGVTVPIEVIPEGIDPAVYHFEERPERAGLTTLMVGTAVGRKHTREGIAAWKRAFGDDPDARLIIKSRFQYGNYVPDDPRIRLVDSNEPTRGIAHWYREADALLALGNEGFGLPMVEAMATGLPVVALSSEGQRDACQEASEYLLPVEPIRWEPAAEPPWGECGVRGVPDVDQVAARLRWIADHRAEARAMGRAASAWAVTHRNVWKKGPAVLDLVEHRSRPPRPLRRTCTMWVPTWGSACGVAEYTTHLAAALPSVSVSAQPPDLRRARVLHVQHESSLFDDAHLAEQIARARQARVPVVVTEHAVGAYAHAWEGDVDALVALTRAGVQTLRTRWPGKRVEHIPHGCPTWFPPRKQASGRVIGAFGFLESHKGFWKLLDVLRQVPNAELLLFSHARHPDLEARWDEAAKGLRVRRVGAFLPVEEVARRLAAEADLLAFWYDEIPHASASGAVRVGLATGVPVLTSPTSWFGDVREVTYQPTSLLEGVQRLLEDTPMGERLAAAAHDYCHEHSWARTGERHLALWRSLGAA